MTRSIRFSLLALGVAFGAAGLSAPASAQATRTWVSGVGDDANPCSRTAPCRTLAGSISKTAAGGEINCLDPVSLGAVTITKSISIICDDVEASILVAGQSAITVNAGANDVVFLSGFNILGFGTVGTNGVNFVNGGALHIRNVEIHGFRGTGFYGLNLHPATANTTVTLDNVRITDADTGIFVKPATVGAHVFTANNVIVSKSAQSSLTIDSDSLPGAFVKGSITNSSFASNGSGPTFTCTTNCAFSRFDFKNSNAVGNTTSGLKADGANIIVTTSDSLVAYNGVGVSGTGGANVISFSNNVVTQNTVNGAFNTTTTTK